MNGPGAEAPGPTRVREEDRAFLSCHSYARFVAQSNLVRPDLADILGRDRLAVLLDDLRDASLDGLDCFVRGLDRELGDLGGAGECRVERGAREPGLDLEQLLHRLDARERLHVGEV